MKALIAAVACATLLVAPAFARSAVVAPAKAKAKAAFAAPFSNPHRAFRSNPTCSRSYNYPPSSVCFTTNGW